jgi:hypothetical protein
MTEKVRKVAVDSLSFTFKMTTLIAFMATAFGAYKVYFEFKAIPPAIKLLQEEIRTTVWTVNHEAMTFSECERLNPTWKSPDVYTIRDRLMRPQMP